MADDVERLVLQMSADIRRMEKALDQGQRKFDRTANAIERRQRELDRNLARMGQEAANFAAPVQAASAVALGAIVGFSINAAKRAEAVEGAFKQIFRGMPSEAEAAASAISSEFGRLETDIKDNFSRLQGVLGALGVDAEQSLKIIDQLQRRSLDIAAFGNVADADAFQAVISGITGETEPLKRFGIVVNETATKAELLRLGFKGNAEQASEAAKAIARTNIIMRQSAEMHGQVYFYAETETTSGRKTAAFDAVVWNESAGHVTLASTNLSMVVDDNNDFNIVDYSLDPVNFSNLSFSTNGSSGASGGTFGQFTGINAEITVRVSISGRSGSMTTATLGAHSNPTLGPYGSGGPWENYTLNALVNSSRDFLVRNGQWMYFDAGGTTSSGRKDHSYTVTLTNVTTGQVIDTFTVSGTVDADNNYNVADYSLDAIDWANIFFDRTSSSWYQEHGAKTLSGINQNITLSMQLANVTYSGGSFQNTALYALSTTRGVLASQIMVNGSASFTVQPNEQIKFGFNVETTGGRRSFGFDVYVYNQTTGALVDHFYCSGFIGS
jgi:hypothetical protein